MLKEEDVSRVKSAPRPDASHSCYAKCLLVTHSLEAKGDSEDAQYPKFVRANGSCILLRLFSDCPADRDR